MRYTIKNFHAEYPNDDACLDYIFIRKYGSNYTCPTCGKTGFYRIKERKCYCCEWCGYQIYPLAHTIFRDSRTSLKNWFYSIFLMSQSRNGVSAKEIERQLGVTYKTAWRIQKQIRKLMIAHKTQMHGVVEVDEAYIGGFHPGTTGRGSVNKTPIVGIVERNGEVRAVVIENVKSSTIVPLIKESVADDARLITDDYNIYRTPALNGYKHDIIRHEFGDYVRGDIHTNNIEGFWSQLKRSIYGTYHHVSRKYLQSYTDEFSYRYNRRDSDKHLFTHLLEEIVEVPVSKG